MNERDNRESWFSEHPGNLKDELKGRIENSLSGFLRGCLVGLLVLLQFAIIIILPFILQNVTIYFYIVLEIFSIILVLNLVNDNRSPSYKIAWICIALALPISGHIMYLLWGKPDSKKKIERDILRIMRHGFSYAIHDKQTEEEFYLENPSQRRISRYMSNEGFPLYKNNQIDYYPMAEDVFRVIFEELEKAEHFILIDFFIVAEGGIWDKLYEILVRKIKSGVEVKFLYDDFGAMIRTEKHFKRKLEQDGFQVRVFNPIHKYTDKLYMNYRSHQKIIVIDGNIGFTGGFNIADEYANLVERFGIWKDNAIRLKGEAVWGLTITFFQMWEVCGGYTMVDYNKYRPTAQFPESKVYCQVISDGPANNPNNPIENIYKQMIYYAAEFLYITTPYLIIEDDMKEALIAAAKGGVDVRILTPYIPDKPHVKLITNYNYGYLLKNGVRIYEYTPGFLHAKTIINENSGVVGTINMDYRSFYLHYENGVWICNNEVIQTVKEDLVSAMEESHEITYEEWRSRPFFMKVKQAVLNMFSTLM
ncbi:cardiolipin synthase [Anaeromicropila populeti]|uniref:Cardiolipin synthase n=1 Tax=Anaeromicropila populeti TaxID=37658 RepID=A0A1I6KHR3_9FIRM|nr:cardiolipin synthase [Anaeromicropila populeti]SFR90782.1 cardiolipin synthase [Anaeromicropila populeti]